MHVLILGSAAGGGFPQWNCNCHNCAGMRNGTLKAKRRTQSSIAVSSNGTDWVLINASPEILTQLHATPALQPARARRDSGIAAVMLTDAQIDHVAGLLMLREGQPIPLYCTAGVWDDLTEGLPLVPVLSFYCDVQWHILAPNHSQVPMEIPGISGISFTPVMLLSKAPPYSPHRHSSQPGDNLGLIIENRKNGKKLFYAPGLGKMEAHVFSAMQEADCVLVDGTFWSADEMIRNGFSSQRAADLGHLPQSGSGGMIEVLDTLQHPRKILIHINNTNPILDEDSGQRAMLTQHGIEVAFDGMEIIL